MKNNNPEDIFYYNMSSYDQIEVKHFPKFYKSIENKENIEYTVAKIAANCYGNTDKAIKDPKKFCEMLIEKKHFSPFEFIRLAGISIEDSLRNNRNFSLKISQEYFKDNVFLFHVKIPIFIARQIMRHRGCSYMELSRRYVSGEKQEFEFYIPDHSLDDKDEFLLKKGINYIKEIYNNFSKKLPNELKRIIMPLNIMTEMYILFDKPTLLNFLLERLKKKTQKDTRQFANMIYGSAVEQIGSEKRLLKYLKYFEYEQETQQENLREFFKWVEKTETK